MGEEGATNFQLPKPGSDYEQPPFGDSNATDPNLSSATHEEEYHATSSIMLTPAKNIKKTDRERVAKFLRVQQHSCS